MDAITLPTQIHRKHFMSLESNADVWTKLMHKLGVSKSLEFRHVLALDDGHVLGFLPRPVYALVLGFPTTEAYGKRRVVDDETLELRERNDMDGDIIFFRQTIDNACGLYAILHAVCNGEARSTLVPDSIIDTIRRIAESLSTMESAMALEADSALEKAYAEVARSGDTEAPVSAEDSVPYHYVCFVKSQDSGNLYQLDGDRKQPIDLGPMAVDEDVLADKCLNVIRDMMASEEGDPRFSLMALVQADI